MLDWREAYTNVQEILGITSEEPVPKIPRPDPAALTLAGPPSTASKRKADEADGDGDVQMTEEPKRVKGEASSTDVSLPGSTDATLAHAQAAAAYITFLDAQSLMSPKMLTREETESVILALRKQALVDEYFGEGPTL